MRPNSLAIEVFKSRVSNIKKKLEEKLTSSEFQKAILGALNSVRARWNPISYTFGNYEFGKRITLAGIMNDQHNIG